MKSLFRILGLTCIAGIALLTNLPAQVVTGFDDIQLWVGSGPNESALLIDFHDGEARQSFVWGYRWSGAATAFDMISAIDSAWQDLIISTPFFVQQITHEESGTTHDRMDGTFASYPEHYTSWGYYLAGGTATTFDSNPPYGPTGTLNVPGGGIAVPVSWTASPAGSADRQLAHGSWDAFSYGSVNLDFAHQTPPGSTPFAAVPEPSSIILSLFGAAILIHATRRIHLG